MGKGTKTREKHGAQPKTLGERLWGPEPDNGRTRRPASPPLRTKYTPFGARMSTWGGSGMGGFHSARYLRESGRGLAFGGSTDAYLRYDLADLRAESQRQWRDNLFFRGIINTLRNVAVGNELTLQANTGDRELNRRLEAWWKQVWERPTLRGVEDGAAVEAMLFDQMCVDGDVGILKHRSGKFQIIEAERIACHKVKGENGNRIESGIELDHYGRHVAYYVADYDARGMVLQNPRRIAAQDFELLALRHRSDQTRGEPLLQILLPMFHRINDICDSEAAAWQILSKLTLRLTTADGAKFGQQVGATDTAATAQDLARRVVDIGDAIIFVGEPGEEVAGVERNIPAASFPETLQMFVRMLGVTIGMPLEFLLMIWSKTSWSSGRMAGKQAQRGCRPLFKRLVGQGSSPLYRWHLGRAIGSGKFNYSPNIFKHEWHPEAYPQMDPDKEASAQIKRLASGQSSPSLEAKAHGGLDWDELVRLQGDDLRRVLEEINKLNKDHPGVRISLAQWTAFVGQQKGAAGGRVMEDVARAVRAGVPVAVSEARAMGLGLPAEAPKGEPRLRFNDADVLQYHIEAGILTINEVRAVLGKPPVPWGDAPVRKTTLNVVGEEGEEGKRQEAGGKREEPNRDREGADTGSGGSQEGGEEEEERRDAEGAEEEEENGE